MDDYIAGGNVNPFNAAQQVYDWGVRYKQASISYAALTQAQGQAIVAFLNSLTGIVNAFTFPAGLVTKYPEILSTDGGTTPRQWKLKNNETKWSIEPGSVYRSITFEIREAL
jgi:hypothetical protein